jgi:hypothetical protein
MLKAGERITFTVRVTSRGPWQAAPRRPDLARLRSFSERFDIQRASPSADREFRKPQAWEFDYTLKPKSASVHEIPPLLFVYYKPGSFPPEKGYRTIDAGPIALTVQAAPVPQEVEPIRASDELFQRASSDDVLRLAPGIPRLGVLGLLLLPPVLCLGWYRLWCRLYPDAARLARQRRSVAARRALDALRSASSDKTDQQAARTALILAAYLRHRLDLPGGEATPADVAQHLERIGCSSELAGKAAELFRTCDQARFAPHADCNGHDLPADAARLILALEAEPCPSAS